jgi:subtilase family serine protease
MALKNVLISLIALLLLVAVPCVALPNLSIYTLDPPASVRAGNYFSVPYSVLNTGTDPAGPFKVGFFLSLDRVISRTDTHLANVGIVSLGVGMARPGNVRLRIPVGTAPGSYYLGAWADFGPPPSGYVNETDETNNKMRVAIRIR